MLNAVLFIAATTFAQTGPTDSVFGEKEEAIVYRYQAEMEQKGAISVVPSAVSFEAFVDYEKAAHAKDRGRCDEMEKQGQIYWIDSGTRCHVVRSWGMSVGPVIRAGREIRLLNGKHKGKIGWILAKYLRKYPRIRIEPPERYTDETWDTPRPLALALQAQDKVVYREMLAAQDNAMTAARGLTKRKRQSHYRAFRHELQIVLDRYALDEATALRILDWGRQGNWPTQNPNDSAKANQ
jgi:hypothetical protein